MNQRYVVQPPSQFNESGPRDQFNKPEIAELRRLSKISSLELEPENKSKVQQSLKGPGGLRNFPEGGIIEFVFSLLYKVQSLFLRPLFFSKGDVTPPRKPHLVVYLVLLLLSIRLDRLVSKLLINSDQYVCALRLIP